MFTLDNFRNNSQSVNFLEILKSKWDELHKNTDIFRYKINELKERIVDEKYFLQLNPDRKIKRRAPEVMNNLCQPFDKDKFNFTKALPKEILFSIEDKDSDIHTILVNVSPINRYHSLLCPSVNKCLPQIVTAESLALAVNIMFLAEDRDLRILFNSLCGFASVNHLHYHLFIDKSDFFVENVNWQCVNDNIYRLDKHYPVPAFCFKIHKDSINKTSKEIYKIIDYFIKKSIAHNILLSRRNVELVGVDDCVRMLLWPRRSTMGAKQFASMNVATLELSGWFPMYDEDNFSNIEATDLENELLNWKIDDFEQLCEDIKSL